METEPSLYVAILATRRADQRQCCVYLKKRLLIFSRLKCGNYGQDARKSFRPKSCHQKPGSCRPKLRATWLRISGDMTMYFGQHDAGSWRYDFGRDDFRATWPVTKCGADEVNMTDTIVLFTTCRLVETGQWWWKNVVCVTINLCYYYTPILPVLQ